ncbi:MAG TPA: response regulator, partial [Elusimicrobiales bacterium]|nr:response regulator [Elusimicrobiales bacterium]
MKFYMYMQEKVIGPYDKEEIVGRFGGLSKDALICRADKYEGGSRKWRFADQVPELSACVKREISEPLPAAEETDAGERALSLRILSTDDDPHIRELLWHMLCDAGHAVEFARDGEEVFKRLGEKRYDLVILDVNMPKMNGYKVSELIHKKMPNPPKVMIFTGRELQKERLQFVCS